ncbi:uncharacterized protein LOC110858976 [Folsomia candida]|uniref:FLYWCH-type domain-containing protein n=1 Tax=Folsomia candida TaxID=158441 RepID=A0A226DER2_FOLCA|nr:uncharacterized protein LOC110858972 [Folsomia candida]XP_021963553.1 uncharacterized protein LOC110858976 [Folsomia candida]XP_021963555.1 uncharacterized protein LOC110858976 [Folsomia candida]XP_035714982.1 uncharacterized protein LOC110858976 [Folsomia candida]XP_035714983.1 uncharacterized protein LOC110858976 [Folsomia candida]XP_035714984.1 uncharacterized protein LOC110858976 [Folsomia candida]XP_035714985.1 uncharacterized protein LOC110858976 [Folsomia candida]XP_035714986.1 unc
MDYHTLLEKVQHLTTTLSHLQEFIDIKFDLDFKEFLRKKHSPPGSTPQTGNERSKSYQVSPPQTEPNNDTFEPEVPNSNGIQHENDVKVEVIETFPYYEAVLESNEGSPGQFFGNDENEDANQDEDDNLEDMEVDKFSIDPLSFTPATSGLPRWKTQTTPANKKSSLRPSRLSLQRPPAGDPLRHAQYGIWYKMSAKGNEKLVYNSYEYSFKRCREARRTSGRIMDWTCVKKNHGCGARISQTEDGTPTVVASAHNHDVP